VYIYTHASVFWCVCVCVFLCVCVFVCACVFVHMCATYFAVLLLLFDTFFFSPLSFSQLLFSSVTLQSAHPKLTNSEFFFPWHNIFPSLWYTFLHTTFFSISSIPFSFPFRQPLSCAIKQHTRKVERMKHNQNFYHLPPPPSPPPPPKVTAIFRTPPQAATIHPPTILSIPQSCSSQLSSL